MENNTVVKLKNINAIEVNNCLFAENSFLIIKLPKQPENEISENQKS